MKGYKGFNKGMICRGKQYKENTVFEEPEANICENGMHFCENPFDVLNYYGFVNCNGELNEFAEVESLDEAKTDDHRKYCTKKLKIGAKLSLTEFIQICAEKAKDLDRSEDFAQISSAADGIQIGVTGCHSEIVSTGFNSKVAFTGNHSKVALTGNYFTVASTGNHFTATSVGNFSEIISTGDYSKVTVTGHFSRVISTGESCIICCTGVSSWVKAKKGSWITLSEWEWNEEDVCVLVCVKTEQVDGERIKEDVFYTLRGGEFQEVV